MTDASAVVVRHGETEWSRSGQHTSRTDLALTDEGRRQAGLIRDRLQGRQFRLVLVSPARRARETAELAGRSDALVDADLVEWDYGDYEGLTTAAIRAERPGWDLFRDGAPHGEVADEVGARADRVIEAIRRSGDPALVFAHGHLLRVLAARWVGLSAADGRVLGPPAAAGIGALGSERGAADVAVWNDTSHLEV